MQWIMQNESKTLNRWRKKRVKDTFGVEGQLGYPSLGMPGFGASTMRTWTSRSGRPQTARRRTGLHQSRSAALHQIVGIHPTPHLITF